jgi:hypothetical protein
MTVRVRRFAAAVLLCGALAVAVPAAAGAFTGTKAAVRLVAQMRAAYSKLPAVSWVLTGDVVYCPAYPEGWTFAPRSGCEVHARVSEQDQLSNGNVVFAVGTVTAPSQPTFRYVVDRSGWYRAAGAAKCWKSFARPYTTSQFVSYPLPGQTLSIVSTTKNQIVNQALTPPFGSPKTGYRELDYIDPRTYLEPHEVLFTTVSHKTYGISYDYTFPPAPPSQVATPTCSG